MAMRQLARCIIQSPRQSRLAGSERKRALTPDRAVVGIRKVLIRKGGRNGEPAAFSGLPSKCHQVRLIAASRDSWNSPNFFPSMVWPRWRLWPFEANAAPMPRPSSADNRSTGRVRVKRAFTSRSFRWSHSFVDGSKKGPVSIRRTLIRRMHEGGHAGRPFR